MLLKFLTIFSPFSPLHFTLFVYRETGLNIESNSTEIEIYIVILTPPDPIQTLKFTPFLSNILVDVDSQIALDHGQKQTVIVNCFGSPEATFQS